MHTLATTIWWRRCVSSGAIASDAPSHRAVAAELTKLINGCKRIFNFRVAAILRARYLALVRQSLSTSNWLLPSNASLCRGDHRTTGLVATQLVLASRDDGKRSGSAGLRQVMHGSGRFAQSFRSPYQSWFS